MKPDRLAELSDLHFLHWMDAIEAGDGPRATALEELVESLSVRKEMLRLRRSCEGIKSIVLGTLAVIESARPNHAQEGVDDR